MDEKTIEKIKKEAEEIINKFSEVLEKFNLEMEESYYIIDSRNVLRDDEAIESNPEFREKFLKIAPKVNKEGYVVVEKGSWLK
ncbi:aspartyl/glutamyl-tRNA amidotransferase subunit C [Methanocaldococcus bathoardescens]|uniref:Aspartyl/glutamyl-tRNA amidotransferase subunit C n=1 Tax=Methanocaldococcus bathoardescens TaxID=1301915 RepID=A0A076LDU9_9EURY|nr:Asp-tRNA(Asn) amidotransferase subunit GatC [Methanocaldococcus bathoardescens]AIJ06401.1 aspartyl/glutamyl-tRNA amidotransferase subunit C [Methanocaldococcus bathoardescens]